MIRKCEQTGIGMLVEEFNVSVSFIAPCPRSWCTGPMHFSHRTHTQMHACTHTHTTSNRLMLSGSGFLLHTLRWFRFYFTSQAITYHLEHIRQRFHSIQCMSVSFSSNLYLLLTKTQLMDKKKFVTKNEGMNRIIVNGKKKKHRFKKKYEDFSWALTFADAFMLHTLFFSVRSFFSLSFFRPAMHTTLSLNFKLKKRIKKHTCTPIRVTVKEHNNLWVILVLCAFVFMFVIVECFIFFPILYGFNGIEWRPRKRKLYMSKLTNVSDFTPTIQ